MKVPGVEGSEDIWLFQRDNRDPHTGSEYGREGRRDWHTEKGSKHRRQLSRESCGMKPGHGKFLSR